MPQREEVLDLGQQFIHHWEAYGFYAPALKDSAMRMDYYDFQQIVASGKQDVNAAQNQVMPAFGTNKNVWCYIDDIYVYLLARGAGDLPRGRPAKKASKSDEFTAQEDSCMNG